jgi:opacity protein-like surface antigen
MKRLVATLLALLSGVDLAMAADMPVAYIPPPILWSWTGAYIGAQVGAGSGNSQFADPAGAAIYGGSVRTQSVLGGGQAGYNWQVPNTAVVLGLEADAAATGGYGSGTCFASSAYFISANCRALPHATGSFTGRLGVATGPLGRTLLYVKGGVAWLDEAVDITSNHILTQVTSFDGARWGWTAGAGIERALTPAWSLRLEYDYAKFGDLGMATPASYSQVFAPFPFFFYAPTPGGTTSVSQNLQTVKVGLNYKFGEDMYAQWEPSSSDYRLRGTTDAPYVPDAEIEIGGRVWYSSGRFQKDLGSTTDMANKLISRLTYDSTAATGEIFARIDTTSNLFLKGFIGGGKILSGSQNDEDWRIFNNTVPYSNTLASVDGDLTYGTVDFGYSLFHGSSAKVGGFVGFNYFRENKSAYGCNQIANPFSDCVPAIPNSTLGITEDDKWYSVRLGVNGVVTVADHLKLTTDVAYLPYVAFRGVDDHVLRTDVSNTISPETGAGQGVQLETILSYAFSNAFSVGAGGRYWAMWAPGASVDSFSQGCPCQALPVRTERYGAFLQASYKIDGLK